MFAFILNTIYTGKNLSGEQTSPAPAAQTTAAPEGNMEGQDPATQAPTSTDPAATTSPTPTGGAGQPTNPQDPTQATTTPPTETAYNLHLRQLQLQITLY